MAVRPPAGLPTISKRARRVLIALVALAVAAILWFQFVGIYVDWLWYGEVGYREVFTTQAVSRVVLFLIAGVGAAGLLFLALFLSYRSRPVFVPTNEVDPLAPYRSVVTARPRLFAFGLSGIVGLVCGLSAQSEWATIQLFLNGGDFGTVDPQFGNDVGFYVFRLPLIQLILSWLFVITVICFIAVAVVQYLFGGIRLGGPGRRITSAATLQLSLLVAVFVLLKAVQYWFDRYELLFSNRNPSFTGASYTDVNAVLPAKIILMVIAAICAVGFVAGAITRSVKLPAIALGLLVLSSVLIGGVWPLVLQQVVVNPNGINREPDFIARNIEATRNAYDIRDDEINYVDYKGQLTGEPGDIVNSKTLPNVRLLDPNVLSPTFTQQRQLKNFYGFPDQLAMDRYTVTNSSGEQQTQDFVVALRELDAQNLNDGQRDWINQHFVYTHGDGFIAAPANEAPSGYPNYVVSDLAALARQQAGGTSTAIPVSQPRTYYGELVPNYAIVGSVGGAAREYDTDTTSYTYTGAGGVPIGNIFQRLVFATQYGEQNFLFSGEINANSKIMYNRDPIDRVKKAAPFLTPDTKAYPAVVDGRIVWIVDAYTTATNYPYAQAVTLSDATANSLSARGAAGQAATQVSYIRNSVKATVDAYDGTVSLYGIDEQDPVLKAWEGVFPGLIKAKSDVSADLQAHFRYPQDLFEVQRSLLVKYHVDDPVAFFQNSGFWKVPNDPTTENVSAPQPPYYLQVQLPGAATPSFQLTSVLTGFQREFMSAYVSASSDPADYGKITVLKLPTDTQTPGPAQVQQLFRTTQQISELVTLSQQQNGARVIFGNLLTLPVNEGLLYVEPFYIQGQASSASSYPQLNKVLVWYAGTVGVGDTLSAALRQATPVQTPQGGDTPIPSNGTTLTQNSSSASPTTQAALPANLQDALQAMDQAESALQAASTSGDLVRVGQATQDLQNAVNNYLSLASAANQTPAASTAPSG